MLTFNIITLFPSLFTEHLANLPFKRATQKNAAEYNLVQLRNYANDKRGTVDDKPYSGGVGMILMIEPIYKALVDTLGLTLERGVQQLADLKKDPKQRIIVLSPRGQRLTQAKLQELSECEQITLINGRYEGIDARVENMATDVISIGDYVISGGELASLVIMEGVTRLLPGILEKEDATTVESFSGKRAVDNMSEAGNLEYPQYTRPEDFRGLKVPEVLLSGNHKEVELWKEKNSKAATV